MSDLETRWLAEHDRRALEITSLRAEVARLRAQLPEGMKHCTIVFKQCDLGHGWLTATNWVQHGCPTCEVALLREADATATKAIDTLTAMHATAARSAEQWHDKYAAERAAREATKAEDAINVFDISRLGDAGCDEIWVRIEDLKPLLSRAGFALVPAADVPTLKSVPAWPFIFNRG